MRKKAVILSCAMVIITATGCGSVNEPCDWCGKSPSVAYKTSDGSDSYVCRDCSKECALCGDKATKRGENMLGMVMFLCKDCYEEAMGK